MSEKRESEKERERKWEGEREKIERGGYRDSEEEIDTMR